jgi:hypothetical protein
MTTFSDNVVVSQRIGFDSELFLLLVGMMQVAAAREGFWIRGGVTIGDLVHDKDVVFGPGLNRAYELESTVAVKPRIVLDANCLDELGLSPDLVDAEENVTFLNSFSHRFFEALCYAAPDVVDKHFSHLAWGVKVPPELVARAWLEQSLKMIDAELQSLTTEKERAKLLWLNERMDHHLAQTRTMDELGHRFFASLEERRTTDD